MGNADVNDLTRFDGLPVLGLAAFSGTGKTTLLRRLLPLLRGHGLRVGMIKHAHHDFDIDIPGKDSYELRKAGAAQMLIASDRRLALMEDFPSPREPELEDLLKRLDTARLDLVLVEGFRHLAFSKIELHRPALGKPLLAMQDSHIIAIACDAPLSSASDLPRLDLNDPEQIARFILERTGLNP